MDKLCAVYILADRRKGNLITSATEDMVETVWQRQHSRDREKLVYFELCDSFIEATNLKSRMNWQHPDDLSKVIEQYNPHWQDLLPQLIS